ncbi:MAG: sigma E protease regulator RseP [Arsenophonus endosymbiont of Ceratovacuna japonica]
MIFFWNISAFFITLCILIIVHEFGHFWVARHYGIYVERFSIGFGKTLWRKVDRYGTEFVISMIPLGGYVKMLDHKSSFISPEKRNYTFNNQKINHRAAVISAGPIANFLLSIFAYWLVFIIGVPSVRPIIQDIQSNSIAAYANILPGMEIKSIDNVKTHDWNEVKLALMSKIGYKELNIEVLPIGNIRTIKKIINLHKCHFDLKNKDPLLSLGIIPVGIKYDSIVSNIKPGTDAALSGLQKGDKIIKVNEQIIDIWHPFDFFVKKSPNNMLLLTIERDGKQKQLTLTPKVKLTSKGQQIGFVGFELLIKPISDKYKTTKQYGLFYSIYKSIDKIYKLIILTISIIGKLIIGDISINNLSGPVSIAKGAGISAASGLVYYLMFIALVSVNLGVINLFPLPALDGGHLLFLLIEKIKGSPVSDFVQDCSYHIGVIILTLLMGFALFNDFSHI